MMSPAGKTGTPAERRYVVRTLAFMGGYVVVNVAAILGAFDEIIGTPAGWLLGLAVAAPVAGQIWATLRLIVESDEFVRILTAKRFIVASGLAMAAFCGWGFVESYGGAPHVPGWMIYPLFWAFFGLVTPFIRTTQ
jgi:putative oxidoreductase